MTIGAELMDAGVDLLYYADPGQDHVDLAEAKKRFGGRMAMAGGINTTLHLNPGTTDVIRAIVRKALEVFGRKDGVILSPVDNLFPDTSWQAVETMIAAWKAHC